MAGEYSRELSSKVFQGACRLIQLGFKQGGTAGFGLRRVLIDQSGQQKATLKMGEHKSLQTDRVILTPGPDEEVQVVRWMYQVFVHEGQSEGQIAKSLNARGILTDYQRQWNRATVHQVLTNEKYIGNNVYHRTSFKLKLKHVANPPEKWIRADGIYVGIIEPEQFHAAQSIIVARNQKLTDAEMLEELRGVFVRHGSISGFLIDESDDLPPSSAFRSRFGSLISAYRLIGYSPAIDYGFIEINRQLREEHPKLMASVVRQLETLGATVRENTETDLLHLNEELRVSIVLCRHTVTGADASRWTVRLDAGLKPDITIAVRMDATNLAIRDYYLLPACDMTWERLRIAEHNGVSLDGYRFESLDFFFSLAARVKIEEAA